MSNYLEERYREFEEEYFRYKYFWRAPARALRNTVLFPVFQRFANSFPDHTGEDNTVFYLTEATNISPAFRSIVLMNDHFEHQSDEDLVELVSFIEYAKGVLNGGKAAFLERLDACREEIILQFSDPRKELIEFFVEEFPRRSHPIDS